MLVSERSQLISARGNVCLHDTLESKESPRPKYQFLEPFSRKRANFLHTAAIKPALRKPQTFTAGFLVPWILKAWLRFITKNRACCDNATFPWRWPLSMALWGRPTIINATLRKILLKVWWRRPIEGTGVRLAAPVSKDFYSITYRADQANDLF